MTNHDCPYCNATMSAVIEIVPDMGAAHDTWICTQCRHTEKIEKKGRTAT